MDIDYPIINEPATPEYVLAVLQDRQRQWDDKVSLTFETTIDEWLDDDDCFDPQYLGRALNETYGINCPIDEWRNALQPSEQKCLKDVCELIARHACRRRMRKRHLFGCSCDGAAAFLTIRSLLHQAGACAESIRPSTPLAPFTRRYPSEFLGPIAALAPGSLPVMSFRTPLHSYARLGAFLGFLVVVLRPNLAPGFVGLTALGAILIAICVAMMMLFPNRPTQVQFGDLKTFRDLAVAIARGASTIR